MEEARSAAVGARGGDAEGVAADMADEREGVGVEGQGEEAVGAEGFVAAVLAEGERGGAAAVVEDESLATVFKIFFNLREQGVGEVAVLREIVAIL